MFHINHVFPKVYHITDAMGVNFTLVEGGERAILFDTGYGTENVKAFIKTLTDKPLTVLISHGHHDHMLGARWFDNTYMCTEDMEEFRDRTGEEQRKKVMKQAKDQNIPVPDDFLTAPIDMPKTILFMEKAGTFECMREDLGDLEIRVIKVPGHTPGSIVLTIPEYDLLLTGDDWNPCTWMWFPTSAAANIWRDRMHKLVQTIEGENNRNLRHVICSHQAMIRQADELKEFLDYMTNERMEQAPAVDMGSPIRTHMIRNEPRGWQLIFDYEKVKVQIPLLN